MKPTITTADSDAQDSISFGLASTVKSADISTGGGSDTIVFDGRMKGKSILATGDGADVIEVNRRSGKGKLRITDFSSDDTLIVDGVTITTDNLEDAPKWIKFGGDPR